METVPKQQYDSLIAEKDKLASDLSEAKEKVSTFAEMKPIIDELKRDFGASKKWNTIAPLIGVVLGGLITFFTTFYTNRVNNTESRRKTIEQLYGDLVYDFSYYSHNLREYHKTQLILSFETAVLEMQLNNAIKSNPKIIYDSKIIELKQYNQKRMDEKIIGLNEYDSKIRRDFKSLMLYSPKLQALDSIVDRLLYYKTKTAESIGLVKYDILLKNYNSEQLDEELSEDMFHNFEQPLSRFFRAVVSFTPELNK